MVQHKLVGNAMQMAVCQLGPGETLYSEAGKFLWKTVNVSMETRLSKPSNPSQPGSSGQQSAGGGMFAKALSVGMDVGKRVLAGESLAFQYFTAVGGNGLITFAGTIPGEMKVIELDGTRGWYAEKDAFIAAEASVNFDIAFSGFKTGRKGGEGFILEKFTGNGMLIIGGAGNFIELNPAKYGGKIQVDAGCLVAFEDTIKYGVERIGGLNAQGAMNALFGGEGLNLATLEGDGQVILQSMTVSALAAALRKHDHGHGSEKGSGGLGGLLSGSID